VSDPPEKVLEDGPGWQLDAAELDAAELDAAELDAAELDAAELDAAEPSIDSFSRTV